MRDTFHTWAALSATGTSAICIPSNTADFGSIDINTGKFSGHHTGQSSGALRYAFRFATTVAVSDTFTCVIQDCATEGGSYTTVVAGPTLIIGGVVQPAMTILHVPMPHVHKRFIRPAVITGSPFTSTVSVTTWLEFGKTLI